MRINNIFNSYFFGSCLWDLFGSEAVRLEKSWNVSQRILLGLPRQSHRYFIEPLSGTKHIRFSLLERYIKFVKNIETSNKKVLEKALMVVKEDCRSTTGRNLRHIMKLSGKTNVNELELGCTKGLTYNHIPDGEAWKVEFAKELLEMKNGTLDGANLTRKEVDDILIEVTT